MIIYDKLFSPDSVSARVLNSNLQPGKINSCHVIALSILSDFIAKVWPKFEISPRETVELAPTYRYMIIAMYSIKSKASI
jgi:hypothetical protein